MTKYAYFRVSWELYQGGERGVYLRSTDMATLEWILAKLQEAGMRYKFRRTEKYLEFDGLKPAANLKSLNDRDGTVALWIIKQLCDNGWEPFASTRNFVALRCTIKDDEEVNP